MCTLSDRLGGLVELVLIALWQMPSSYGTGSLAYPASGASYVMPCRSLFGLQLISTPPTDLEDELDAGQGRLPLLQVCTFVAADALDVISSDAYTYFCQVLGAGCCSLFVVCVRRQSLP